ncbi:GIY-YIG nuclease family protein [Peribacillus butanolivorans]|nr:GIY-YIG nuclease family protein [Peribacillus butanolivorans]
MAEDTRLKEGEVNTLVKIELDNVSEKFHVSKLNFIQDKTGGIYFLYNLAGELMYIGRSKCLKDRLYDHFNGKTHTIDFHKEFHFFRVLYTNSRVEQKIYELYAINALKPKYNQMDVYEEEHTSIKSHEEIEKDNLIFFIVRIMKKNKDVAVGISTMRMICENNRLLCVSLFDEYVLSKLKENNIHLSGREFVYAR